MNILKIIANILISFFLGLVKATLTLLEFYIKVSYPPLYVHIIMMQSLSIPWLLSIVYTSILSF